MVKRVVIWVILSVVALFLIVWLITGGASRAWNAAHHIGNPVAPEGKTSGWSFLLPWQPDFNQIGTDISKYSNSDSPVEGETSGDKLNTLQSEYDQLEKEAKRVKYYGNPSPLVGQVVIGQTTATEVDPQNEYVELRNVSDQPVSISRWSLQDVYSGVQFSIPPAASPLQTGTVNTLEEVTLNPGESAYIISGVSPVGVSFHDNRCIGYLEQFQKFTPALGNTCPDPSLELPVSEENLHTYGDTCIDFVRSLPRCHFPITRELPSGISPACQTFVGGTFSYNGCVALHRFDEGFFRSWHLYLASNQEIWRNSHDIIRLLDERGQTIDVVTY